jgi:hypothetical protein
LVLAVTSALSRPNTRINSEVLAPNSNLRADLVVNGRGALNQELSTIDLSVVSFSSQKAHSLYERCVRAADETPIAFGSRVGALLRELREREKRSKYRLVFPDIIPMVFLPGGSTNLTISKWLGRDALFRIAAALAGARVAQS